MIEDETNHELKQSLELRKLLRESLEGCVVSINTKVSISIRAKSVTLEVYSPLMCPIIFIARYCPGVLCCTK